MDINNFGYISKDIMNIIEDYNDWKIIFNKSLKIINKIDKSDYHLMRQFYEDLYCNKCGDSTCYKPMEGSYTRMFCKCHRPKYKVKLDYERVFCDVMKQNLYFNFNNFI